MQKLKSYSIAFIASFFLLNTAIPLLPPEIIARGPEAIKDAIQTKEAQAAQGGPDQFQIAVQDDNGGNGQCSTQYSENGNAIYTPPSGQDFGYVTDTNLKDPNCARIKLHPGNATISGGAMYTTDFRIGIALAESAGGCTDRKTSVSYTGWASEGGGSAASVAGGGVQAADCIWIYYQTRPLPNGSVRIVDAQAGIGVGNGALRFTPWASEPADWSGWSTTSGKDFTTARIALNSRLNYKYNADFVSTTVPQYPPSTLTKNVTNSYNIVMKNIPDVGSSIAMPWVSDQEVSSSTNRGVDHCDQWVPSNSSETCTQTTVLTSSKFKLRRTDSSTGAVQTTSGDLPYSRTITSQYSATQVWYDGECRSNGPEAYHNSIFNIFKVAQAVPIEPGGTGETCDPPYPSNPPVYNALYVSQNKPNDVLINDTASFDVNVTAIQDGDYQLKFQMVNTELNERFGDENAVGNANTVAKINVRIGTSWSFACGVNQTVTQGNNANYILSATVPNGYTNSINVTMAGIPAGPAMQSSPVVLTSGTTPVYTGTAVIPTGSLVPNQTYTLTFTANDGSSITTCQSTLNIVAVSVTVDLKFNGSDGPVDISGGVGTLTWTSRNAANCIGSMQLGLDTSSPVWTGQQNTANVEEQAFNATGLNKNSYEFKIVCSNGSASGEDFVRVNVLEDPPIIQPTADIKCMGEGEKDPQDGPCAISAGGTATLTWDSQNATRCGIAPDFGSVNLSEPDGQSTPNLNGNRTYIITCEGVAGAGDAVDSVTINVTLLPEPPNTPTISVANYPCGYITVTVNSGPVPPPVTGWVLGWGTSAGNISTTIAGFPTPIPAQSGTGEEPLPLVWVHGTTSTPPAGVDPARYSYSPAAAAIGNYYKAAAVNQFSSGYGSNPNTWPTGVTTSSGINLVNCVPGLNLSDKDIIAAGTATNPTSIYSVPGVPCNGTHEVIPNNRIFKNGEVVTYKLNACNNGSQDLTNVTISDTLENLVYVPNSMSASPAGCATLASQVGTNISFNLSNIGAPASPSSPTVCSITLRATITAPPGSPSALYRFRNSAVLNTAQGISNLRTPYYLFSLGAGVPDRTETPPQ